jgi:hypothetical protein
MTTMTKVVRARTQHPELATPEYARVYWHHRASLSQSSRPADDPARHQPGLRYLPGQAGHSEAGGEGLVSLHRPQDAGDIGGIGMVSSLLRAGTQSPGFRLTSPSAFLISGVVRIKSLDGTMQHRLLSGPAPQSSYRGLHRCMLSTAPTKSGVHLPERDGRGRAGDLRAAIAPASQTAGTA